MEKIVRKAIAGFEPDNSLYVRFSFEGVNRPVAKVLEWDNYEVGVNAENKPVYIRMSRAETIDMLFGVAATAFRAGRTPSVEIRRHMLLHAYDTASGIVAMSLGQITEAAVDAEAESLSFSAVADACDA